MKVQTVNESKDLPINSTIESEAGNEAEKVFIINMETGKLLKNQSYANNFEEFKPEFDEKKSTSSESDDQPSTRSLRLSKVQSGDYGFHITRTKWDPYPWINRIDAFSPAEISGLKVGDCVLKVNGTDVLGMRLTDIAKLVKCKSSHVTLHLWSAGCDAKCDPETLCDAPMPETLQRLSIIVQSILSIIECPVCLETISPPAMQCQNGHLLCVNCRIRAEKCPVCRDRYTPRPALIAEQIYAAITSAFNLCRNEDKLRHKLFGTNVRQQAKQTQQSTENVSNNMATMSRHKAIDCATSNDVKGDLVDSPSSGRNKFLTKLLHGKASSMHNLSNTTTATTKATTHTVAAAATITTTRTALHQASSSSVGSLNICKPTLNAMTVASGTNDSTNNNPPKQSTTNQLNCAARNASSNNKNNNNIEHLNGHSVRSST